MSDYLATRTLADGRIGYVFPLLGGRARLGVSQAGDLFGFENEW